MLHARSPALAMPTPLPPAPNATAPSADAASPAELRERLAEMEDRERKVMALLGCTDPRKIDHDLRNVINELVLLRKVLEQEDA